MTLRHLRIFIEVCKLESITQAATSLNIAQPTVSLVVKELEAYYRTKLFDRMNRKIYLTQAGEILFHYGINIVDQVEEVEQRLRKTDFISLLRVGSNVSFGEGKMPSLLEKWRKKYPEVKIVSYIGNSDEIEKKLLKNEVDFAIVDNLNISPFFRSKLIKNDTMIMMCGKEYAKEFSKNILLEHLRDKEFLLRERGSGSRSSVEDVFASKGIQINIGMESRSVSALVQAGVHNLGILVAEKTFVKEEIKNGDLVELFCEELEFRRSYFLTWHKEKVLSPKMKEFMNLLQNI